MSMMKTGRRAIRGVSLVEIMVGITIGLFVLVGLSSVYINSVRGGRTTTATNQLSQELRALMDIMVNDIRRAGYRGPVVNGAPNPFTTPTTQPVISTLGTNRDCILYSYDAPAAILPGGDPDFTGFQLSAGGVVQMIRPGTLASTATGCNAATWDNVTDEVSTEVTRLAFNTGGSKCIAIAIATGATIASWTTAGGTNGPACAATASNAPSPYPVAAAHHFVETRRVNIELIGRSRTDATLPPLRLQETVLIRANRVIKP